MAIQSLAQRTVVTAAAGATHEIRSTAGNKPKIMEYGFTQVTAVAGTYGLGRPAAIGITPTNVLFLDEADGNGPAALTNGAVAWVTPPTVPANFMRRLTCAATIGVGAIWTFPRGLALAVSFSVVLWIIATAPVLDAWVVADE